MSKNTKSFLLESLIVVRLSLVEKTKNQRSARIFEAGGRCDGRETKKGVGPCGRCRGIVTIDNLITKTIRPHRKHYEQADFA
jgi:hypothetical protein